MTEALICPDCGSELPATTPEGLCPRCLLQRALESSENTPVEPNTPSTAASGGAFITPTPAELASHFPQLEIVELLGYGGMGAVYKARQPKLDRLVAIKILPQEGRHDPAFAERFNREARALAKLDHSNIVRIHDFGQTPPSPVLGEGPG